MAPEISVISAAFGIDGTLVATAPHGNGHINDTYVATYEHAGGRARYLHQRINHLVFPNPSAVMDNILRVAEHLRDKLKAAGDSDIARRMLEVVPTRDGQALWRHTDGSFWRTYRFIDDTVCHESIANAEQAYRAAAAFGRFQAQLADLPAEMLVETIPDFHHTPGRWAAFEGAQRTANAQASTRADRAQREIAFAYARRTLAHTLATLRQRGLIPERVAHNDAKINNLLFDARTGEALCVVDLDTVMPGLSLFDFGDMVRTMTCLAAEDERDLELVEVQRSLFDAVVRGYLDTAHGMLNGTERAALITAAETIIFEQGLRFLTDYLAGDVYYKTTRPDQNLDRCRTQFALLASIDRQRDALRDCVSAQFSCFHPQP